MQPITESKPWAMSPLDVLAQQGSILTGLSSQEATKRLTEYGQNTFFKREKISPVRIFLKQFTSPLIFILIAAAVLTGLLNEWVEVAVISLAVIINGILGFYQEYHAENTLEKLISFIKDRSRVIRDGHEIEIDSALIVPGDIVKLAYGARVPADVRILSVNNFRVDESLLTGESLPIAKSVESVSEQAVVADRVNMAHAGTLVVDGFATAVVIATGHATEIGKIAEMVSATRRAITPIQTGVKKLAWLIFVLALLIVIGIFILGISRGEPIIEMLILSAAVSVGAVPEALPIALTVILAIGAERIAQKKGVIRTLSAAETLGSTTLIMTDKTGTLTMADMQLVGVFPTKEIVSGATLNHVAHLSPEQKHILDLAMNNIDVVIENTDNQVKDWTFIGKPFEVNIAKAGQHHSIDIDRLTQKSTLVLPFNSTNKFSVSNPGHHMVVMGAPDVLLKRAKVSKQDYLTMSSWIDETSATGSRLLGIATMALHPNITPDQVANLEFVGIMAFHDPVRPEVPAAIEKIESYGIQTVMITGDIKGTAMSVARDLGWDVNDDQVITGDELAIMSDEILLERLPKTRIFARVTPEDKLRVGKLYQSLGEIVAMTGDGVNDAPALKSMDIGVAIGSGSDVAKSAADLVLLDDNFQTISTAIQEGRKILINIQKTFVYLMSNSLDEVFVIVGSLIAGLALPLTALQIIWVNFFTGSFPALAFAFDENLDDTKTKKHAFRSIFTLEVKIMAFGLGVVTSALLFVLYKTLLDRGISVEVARAIFFVCFSSYVLVSAFSFRSLHKAITDYHPFSNKKLNLAVIFATFLLIITVTVPFFQDLFDIALIPGQYLWIIVGWLVLNVALVEFAKFCFRRFIK